MPPWLAPFQYLVDVGVFESPFVGGSPGVGSLWCLRLPEVDAIGRPGYFPPLVAGIDGLSQHGFPDHRKEQEASAFIWAQVQGEPCFAPCLIEASQPEPVRRDWTSRRDNLWHKLRRPGRIIHCDGLRKLLLEHGDRLAKGIDCNAPPVLWRTL